MAPSFNARAFAITLRGLRGDRSYRQLAKELGMTVSILHRLEHEAARPDIDTFVRLCVWMDVPMQMFVTPTTETDRPILPPEEG